MNARRNLLIVLGAAPFTPRAVFAQAKKPPALISWLSLRSRESDLHLFAAFMQLIGDRPRFRLWWSRQHG